MINPSANAWIEKFFQEQNTFAASNSIADDYYSNLRDSGFIYGHIVSIPSYLPIPTDGWLKIEVYKVALLNNLYQMYVLTKQQLDTVDFVNQAVAFYNQMNPQGTTLLHKILPKNTPFFSLEKILDERIRTNENGISKNFTHLVTNALLFIDILAFKQYLQHQSIPEKYLKKIEETIMSIVTLALKTKSNKSKHDDLLIKLFEASVRYSKFSNVNYENLEALQLGYFTDELEKKYLLDVADLTLWSDGIISNNEKHFLYKLAEIMNLSDEIVEESILKTDHFITTYKSEIPYFNATSPVKNFYTQTTKSVELLISRNKKRLLKELSESKELMLLLAASTRRDLDEKEKKKVKIQLLDICKSIPSLTIFLLPGGSLLLPILIKFIPKLLPSSFNENLEE
jgi:hypothetical protein